MSKINLRDKFSVESKRLVIRKYVLSDAEQDSEIGNDKEVFRFVENVPQPYTVQKARNWIKKLKNQKLSYFFAIELKKTGKLIGTIWLKYRKKSFLNYPEIGIIIGRKYRGRGYAKEAINAFVGFTFSILCVKGVLAKIKNSNHRSIKLFRLLGFVLTDDLKIELGSKNKEEVVLIKMGKQTEK